MPIERDNRFLSVPRVAIVAPTFNNAATLPLVLAALDETGLTVIVVDDGSTDQTGALLVDWEACSKRHVVVKHPINRGKAAALRTGFDRATELGFAHALTIDTDGQHDPAHIPALLGQINLHPDAIVLGNRVDGISACPLKNLVGRKVSNFVIGLVSGLWVNDSQCGLRIYPLERIRRLGLRAPRYAFESEVLAYAGFAQIPVVEVEVRCIYELPRGPRVTHFRPWSDSTLAALMFCRVLARSVHPKRFPSFGDRLADDASTGTLWTRFARWANPIRSWRKLRYDMIERDRLALSLGWGAFMALQPPFGLKTVICLALSKFFRLQPVVVLGVSSLTTPPLGVAAWTLSILVGNLLIHQRISSQQPSFNHGMLWVFRTLAAEWCVGALALGCLIGLGFAFSARVILRKIPVKTV